MSPSDTRAYVDRLLLIASRTGALLVLVTPLIVTWDSLFPFVVGKAVYSRALIEITLGIWIVLAVRNAAYRPAKSRLMAALAVYLGVSLIASFTGVSLQRSLWSTYERMQGVVDLAHWAAFALVLTSVFRTSRDWRHLLNASLVVSLVMALVGLAGLQGWYLPWFRYLAGQERVVVTLGNATYVGAYMLINVLIAAALLAQSFTERSTEKGPRPAPARRRRRQRERKRDEDFNLPRMFWQRLFWVVVIVLDLWIAERSATRGALVGLAGALVVAGAAYVVWGRLRMVKIATVSIVVGLAVIGSLLMLSPDTAAARWLSDRSALMARSIELGRRIDINVRGRLSSVSSGLEGFAERPILGWGPENYTVPWSRFHDADAFNVRETFDQAHSKPIDELITRGAVGLISYGAIWVIMFWIVFSRVRRLGADKEMLTLILGAAMAGYFVQNLFLFDTPAMNIHFAVLLAFAVSLETARDGPREGGAWDRWTSAAVNRLRLRGLAWPAELRTPAAGWAAAALLVVVVSGTVYLANVRAYQSALGVASALGSRDDWPERLGLFERAIDTFPPLSNYTRIYLLNTVAREIERVSETEPAETLDTIDREVANLFGSEPEWWYAYLHAAHAYISAAALINREYLDVARTYTDRAVQLAPEVPAVVELQVRQEDIDKAYGVNVEAEPSP